MPFDSANFVPPPLCDTPTTRLLRAALALIESPRHWRKGQHMSGRLWWKRYCAVGAMLEASRRLQVSDFTREDAGDHLHAVARRIRGTPIMVNDSLGHAATVQMFRTAIEQSRR